MLDRFRDTIQYGKSNESEQCASYKFEFAHYADKYKVKYHRGVIKNTMGWWRHGNKSTYQHTAYDIYMWVDKNGRVRCRWYCRNRGRWVVYTWNQRIDVSKRIYLDISLWGQQGYGNMFERIEWINYNRSTKKKEQVKTLRLHRTLSLPKKSGMPQNSNSVMHNNKFITFGGSTPSEYYGIKSYCKRRTTWKLEKIKFLKMPRYRLTKFHCYRQY